MTVEISILLAVVSCLIAVAGWLSTRDKKSSQDAEWRGTVSGKLDGIQMSVTGMQGRQEKMDDKVDKMDQRLIVVEQSAKSAHHRLDQITGSKGE